MKNETVSKIFEPYFTTKANGTGLGMTMVYKIIKEFSGDIQVESQEGKGTVFTMQFPLQQDGTLAIEEA
jgi:signal transduction histidine kinase